MHDYILLMSSRYLDIYDIDGLRFDLMGLTDIDTVNDVYKELKKKKAADKLAAKDASSSKGKPSVQVEPNRALLQKLALQIAEKKTYTEEDRRKDEEAREAARQAAVEAGAEQYALDQHEKVVEQFEKGRKGDKSTTFDGGPRERVCYHLLERGGGLTEQEIFDDLNRTRNAKWR